MSHGSHDATRQCLGITGVSPVRLDTGLPHPSYPPLMRLPARTSRSRRFFLCLSKQPARRHGYRSSVADHQVIQYPHADQPQCLP